MYLTSIVQGNRLWYSPLSAVGKFRERLAVSKQIRHRFHMEKFNLKKLNEVEGKEQYLTEITNRFAALENIDTEVDIT
jgi:hypothetical protein